MRKTLVTGLCAAIMLAAPALAGHQVPLTPGLHDEQGDPGYALGYTNGIVQFVDFLVPLEAGKDYFLGGVSDDFAHTLEVLDPANRVVRPASASGVFGPDGRQGFEFRAASTATYRLRARQVEEVEGPAAFGAYAGPDCRGGTTARCTLRVGTSGRGRWDVLTEHRGDTLGITEHDYYKVRLTAGRTYSVTLSTSFSTSARVAFVDAQRRELAGAGRAEPDTLRATSFTARFKPSRTGDYWIKAAGTVDTTYYTLLVR